MLDLSGSDVTFAVPDIADDMNAMFSFYDPFGNNFANIGGTETAEAGNHWLKHVPVSTTVVGVSRSGGSSASCTACINSPSCFTVLLVRWLVVEDNQDRIKECQASMRLENVERSYSGTPSAGSCRAEDGSEARLGPHVCSPDVLGHAALVPPRLSDVLNEPETTPEKILRLLAKVAPSSVPATAPDKNAVFAMLASAGLSTHRYVPVEGVDLDSAYQTALKQITEAPKAASKRLNNGWTQIAPELTGEFGTNYSLRAAIAASGYLMLKAPSAVYPMWHAEGAETGHSMHLGSDESYIYTFSSKPPLRSNGFWSLTACAGDQYLIPNKGRVYALGDRSNIRYPHGRKVYGPNAGANDGIFQILMQAADREPPDAWADNWLPGPAGGGDLVLVLRWYGAQERLLDGTYLYPVVTKQTAICRSRDRPEM
ncbi:hypothetical protein LTR37_003609 [Vermiconidia calcicola]|uniref:Uncharacterized protein n=1 Tax=Vermiconidia calcicola TaxID=1690605 RepID=A0ACC3NQS0_9PEZI|nr:hypothetical protein LTR37_003609 [Vermiconidia calcicola]